MKFVSVITLTLALTSIAQAAPKFGEMAMTSPNSARIVYEDKCSNGGNIDKEKRAEFVKAMLAQPKSKLAKIKANLLKEIGDDARGEGVYVSDNTTTFHDRDGCGLSRNSFSFFVVTVTGGNTNHTVSRFLVNVDDDDNAGVRTLKVRSIQALKIRDDN